jgi:uncharacterized protein YgbK (DUF1537 family)
LFAASPALNAAAELIVLGKTATRMRLALLPTRLTARHLAKRYAEHHDSTQKGHIGRPTKAARERLSRESERRLRQ